MRKVQARIIAESGRVYLEKFCPEHRFSRTLLSTDVAWYEQSMSYIKPREYPLKSHTAEFAGCPESCGLCTEHQQHTCLPVIEITDRCDIDCPVCLKDFDDIDTLTTAEYRTIIDELLASEKTVDVINLSGGEPTMHPDLENFIRYALEKGVTQVSVSTNGLTLLRDANLRRLFRETGTVVALQFDGFESSTYEKLRQQDMSQDKLRLIEIMEAEEVRYSLVTTVAKGINDVEISRIVDSFFESQALSIMFQPVAFTGSASVMNVESHRLTIPDVVREIEKSRYVKPGDFNPLPCSHYSCFALSYYLAAGDGTFHSLKDFLGFENYLQSIANKTLPGLDLEGMQRMKERMYEIWSAADSSAVSENILRRIKSVLCELESCGYTRKNALDVGMKNMKAVFIHHFMDIHNFDFGRIVKCCNPYAKKDGMLVPICSQNIFHIKERENLRVHSRG
jgi:hypothetical protein